MLNFQGVNRLFNTTISLSSRYQTISENLFLNEMFSKNVCEGSIMNHQSTVEALYIHNHPTNCHTITIDHESWESKGTPLCHPPQEIKPY